MTYREHREEAIRYYALCERADALGIDTTATGEADDTVERLESRVIAATIVAAVTSLPADPGEAALELHGQLVTLPYYAEGRNPLLDAILTALERRVVSGGGHSVRA